MTPRIKEFLETLGRYEWGVEYGGRIRSHVRHNLGKWGDKDCYNDVPCCPLTRPYELDQLKWRYCAEDLGLSEKEALRIVKASDKVGGYSKKLRREILKACGLPGEK